MNPERILGWILLLSAALWLLAAPCGADGNVRFEHITIREGLSQSSVRSILQDRRGFMWFATVDGLNRYDGYTFKIHKYSADDPNTPSSPFLRAMVEDHQGNLWMGTNGGGLNKYDPTTERFTRYQYQVDDPAGISNDYVWAVHEDRFHILWLGTDGGGFNRFNRETGTFTRYRHEPGNPDSLSHDRVLSICRDRFGTVWIGTRGGGLNAFDPVTGHFTHYRYDPADPAGLGSDHVWSVYEDRDGVIWAGTDGGGAARFDRETGTFFHYRHEPGNPDSLSHNDVYCIYQDREGMFWFGTNGGGVNKFDPESGGFTRYRHMFEDPNSISGNYIHSICEDRSGVLWFGTENGGVNKLDRTREQFRHYRRTHTELTGLNDNSLWAIYEDKAGAVWAGTRSCQIMKLDRETGAVKYYEPGAPGGLRRGEHIRVIYEAPSEPGILWIGVDGAGVHRFDPARDRFTWYAHDPDDDSSLSDNRVYSIYEDGAGDLWVGTRMGGLNQMDRDTGTFTHYRDNPADPLNSVNNDYIYIIREDRRGNLWVGTFSGGLNQRDRETGTFRHYVNDVGDPHSISNNTVLCIHEDGAGDLWVGTGGGLNKMGREKGRFQRYGTEQGLPNEVIYGILEDERGALWLSTNNGLSRFDPRSETFKNYEEIDGLQSNEFNGGSYFRSPRTGEMLFGGINGFNAFFPGKITPNTHVPPVVLTAFLKFNKEEKLRVPLSELKELRLSHRDYVFSFEFAALDYTAPRKNQYAYKMEGLSNDWISTGAWKRFADFTTLSPGEYVFRVKGSNNDGVWNEAGAAIRVIITPPLWRVWWFQLLVVLLGAVAALLLYRRNMRHVSVRARLGAELQTAHKAQMAIMPQGDPGIDGFDISGLCIPANEVGGDFFDYLWVNDEKSHLCIAVGDVSGKAMNAAMTAVMSDGIFAAQACCSRSTKEIMDRVNRPLCMKSEKHVFTALCLMTIEMKTRRITFTNAGLNEPLLKSGAAVSRLEGAGPRLPLGINPDVRYGEKSLQLNGGDVVVLYSDGLSESWNDREELYGAARLSALLQNIDTAGLSAREIIRVIMDDIADFSGDTPQQDDMTVVVVKVL